MPSDASLGRDAQRILPFLDEAALHAVGSVGELHAAVADRRSAVAVEHMRLLAHGRGDFDPVGEKQALIAGTVGHELIVRRDVGVAFDQAADSG